MHAYKLTSSDLYKEIPLNIIDINTTLDVLNHDLILVNYKAIQAILLGLQFDDNNHHIFTISEDSFEMISMLKQIISQQKTFKVLWDWIYVYNPNEAGKFVPINLAINTAYQFKKDIDNLKHNLEHQVVKLLKSDAYAQEISNLDSHTQKEKQLLLHHIREEARLYNLIIVPTDDKEYSFSVSPANHDGLSLTVTEFERLTTSQQADLQEKAILITNKLDDIVKKLKTLDLKKQKNIEKITLKLVTKNVQTLIRPLKKTWKDQDNIINYLNDITACIIEKFRLHINNYKTTDIPLPLEEILQVLIINSHNPENINAQNPIIIGYDNEPLFSKLEYTKDAKTNKVHIYKITPGLLHKANGGVLVVSAQQIIENKPLWESLKYILLTKKLPFTYRHDLTNETNKIFQPLDICLDIKIILIGNRTTYSKLKNNDPTFSYLFKIVSEFDTDIPITQENILNAAILLSKQIQDSNSKHLTKEAFLTVCEIGSILTEKQSFMTTELSKIFAVIQEASLLAKNENETFILAQHIRQAYAQQKERSNQFSLLDESNIRNNSLLLDTKGTKVGQINAIYTSAFNGFTFGHAQRVTAVVSKNNTSKISHVDIEVSLSGEIHSKAVMILEAYINSTFGKHTKLGFTASIAFEQSYGKINGDSASCAETIATLSALSNIPIKQGISITASMDQKGNIQAVGEINAKIEGYFKICKQIGLDGTQGVIIPRSNVQNLMLPKEIRDAIDNNFFHIYAITHINEIITIIMDTHIGTINQDNNFEKGSLGYLITQQWGIAHNES